MNQAIYATFGCVLLLLCGACGDDDAAKDEAPVHGNGDAGEDASAPPSSDDDATNDGGSGSTGTTRDGGHSTSGAGDASAPGSEPGDTTDAATPPAETTDAGGTSEQPSDAAVTSDAAVEVTDCDSLAACCEQLRGGARTACENAIEAANDDVCVELARRACSAPRDGGAPGPMPCAEVLECCTGLEGRQQAACEAAAAAPEGRACDRAVETYCQ